MADLSRRRISVFLSILLVGVLFISARTLAEPKRSESTAPEPTVLPATTSRPEIAALANLNYLHTEGTKIVDSHGKEVRLTGVSWFGSETDTQSPHGLWARSYKEMLDQIVKLGFNTIRLPYSNEIFNPDLKPQGVDTAQNPDLKGLNGLQIMDKIIVGAGERGLKVILDQHRPNTDSQSKLWYTDELTEEQWIADWQQLALRYFGNDTVIGADLHNEPAGDSTWGTGDPKTDWRLAAEKAGNAILEINPHWLIIVEGIEKTEDDFGNVMDWYWMGGTLQHARYDPIRLKVPNQLVYAAHDYGPEVYMQGWFSDPDFPENLDNVWDHHWGYLAKEGIAPVLLGEFGGNSVGEDLGGIWQRSLIKYLKNNNISYLFWSFNGNSGDTGGILKDDWRSYNEDKVKALSTYQDPLIPSVSPSKVDTTAGTAPRPNSIKPIKLLHKDVNKEKWSQNLVPELHVANKTLQPMDIGGYEARYWFTADGPAESYTAENQIIEIMSVKAGDKGMESGKVKAEIVKDPNYQRDIDPVYYVKLTFAPGVIVAPRDTVAVAFKIHKKDWSPYFQDNDYSHREYHWQTEWDQVGLYKDGKLIWGVEPQVFEQTVKQKQLDKENRALAKLKAKK